MKKAEKLARKLFSDADLEAVSKAIKSFETKTSGEIVISFNATSHDQPDKTARRIFRNGKLYQTRDRNATLIALFLTEQKFAVYGDVGIHEKVPDGFWDDTVNRMRTEFAAGRMLAGLLAGINQLGEQLAHYFPVAADDVNELSDDLQFSDSKND